MPTHKALYHADRNRIKKQEEQVRFGRYKRIVDILIKNCEVLDELKDERKGQVSKEVLENYGFKFNYYTHISKRGEHSIMWWFDNGLKIIGGNQYEIVN